MCQAQPWLFVFAPFVVEVLGRLGPATEALVSQLTQVALQRSVGVQRQHHISGFHVGLAVALQRAEGDLIRSAIATALRQCACHSSSGSGSNCISSGSLRTATGLRF